MNERQKKSGNANLFKGDVPPAITTAESDTLAEQEFEGEPPIDLSQKVLDHDKELRRLNYFQVGVLIVVGVGFIAGVIGLLIFFVQTAGHSNDTIDALRAENGALRNQSLAVRMDSVETRIARMSVPTKVAIPHKRQIIRRKRVHHSSPENLQDD